MYKKINIKTLTTTTVTTESVILKKKDQTRNRDKRDRSIDRRSAMVPKPWKA